MAGAAWGAELLLLACLAFHARGQYEDATPNPMPMPAYSDANPTGNPSGWSNQCVDTGKVGDGLGLAVVGDGWCKETSCDLTVDETWLASLGVQTGSLTKYATFCHAIWQDDFLLGHDSLDKLKCTEPSNPLMPDDARTPTHSAVDDWHTGCRAALEQVCGAGGPTAPQRCFWKGYPAEYAAPEGYGQIWPRPAGTDDAKDANTIAAKSWYFPDQPDTRSYDFDQHAIDYGYPQQEASVGGGQVAHQVCATECASVGGAADASNCCYRGCLTSLYLQCHSHRSLASSYVKQDGFTTGEFFTKDPTSLTTTSDATGEHLSSVEVHTRDGVRGGGSLTNAEKNELSDESERYNFSPENDAYAASELGTLGEDAGYTADELNNYVNNKDGGGTGTDPFSGLSENLAQDPGQSNGQLAKEETSSEETPHVGESASAHEEGAATGEIVAAQDGEATKESGMYSGADSGDQPSQDAKSLVQSEGAATEQEPTPPQDATAASNESTSSAAVPEEAAASGAKGAPNSKGQIGEVTKAFLESEAEKGASGPTSLEKAKQFVDAQESTDQSGKASVKEVLQPL